MNYGISVMQIINGCLFLLGIIACNIAFAYITCFRPLINAFYLARVIQKHIFRNKGVRRISGPRLYFLKARVSVAAFAENSNIFYISVRCCGYNTAGRKRAVYNLV